MNMAETNRERLRLYRIAEFTGLDKNPGDETRLFPEQQQDDIIVSWNDDRTILSTLLWDGASWDCRIAIIQAALTILDCIADAPTAQLHWSFSPKVIERADAGTLLAQWLDQGAPPVMELIGLAVEDIDNGRLIRTVGLAAIFGHELDAVMLSERDNRLAKMVAHLAQDMLRDGPLNSAAAVGPDGMEYLLTLVSKGSGLAPTVRITAA